MSKRLGGYSASRPFDYSKLPQSIKGNLPVTRTSSPLGFYAERTFAHSSTAMVRIGPDSYRSTRE